MRRSLAVYLVIAMASSLFCRGVMADDCTNLASQPRLIGWASLSQGNGCAVSMPHVYVANGDELVVLDVTDAGDPRSISSLTLPHNASAVEEKDSFVYVALWENGLAVVDVTNAEAPVLMQHFDAVAADDLDREGDVLVAVERYNLHVFDVSTPGSPALIGSHPLSTYGYQIDVENGRAYVGSWTGHMEIYDISDATAISLLGSYAAASTAHDMVVEEYTAYVAVRTVGLVIVDVHDPANPVELGVYQNEDVSLRIEKCGDRVLLGDSYRGLKIVNVADPSNPIHVAKIGAALMWKNTDTAGDLLFLPMDDEGLQIIDTRGGTPPPPIAVDATTVIVREAVARDEYLFVAGWPTVHAYRLDEAGGITPLSGVDLEEVGTNITLEGDRAYVAAGHRGLQIVDITDPESLTLLGCFDDGFTQIKDMDVVKETAYVVSGTGDRDFWVLDVSRPEEIEIVGHIILPYHATAIKVAGRYAYTLCQGLCIIDISSPESPFVINIGHPDGAEGVQILETADWSTQDILIKDNLAYILHRYDVGLSIYDINQPYAPNLIARYDTPLHAYRLAYAGDLLLIGAGYAGVQVMEAADPAGVRLLGFVEIPYAHTGCMYALISQGSLITGISSAGVISFPLPCHDLQDILSPPTSHDALLTTAASIDVPVYIRPNPANPMTIIEWNQPSEGPGTVRVYDIAGRLVRSLTQERFARGVRRIVWNGRDDTDRAVSSGRYFVRVRAPDVDVVRGVTLVK